VWEYRGPEFDEKQFFGAFWTMDDPDTLDRGFTAMRDHLAHQNDVTNEMIAIFKERCVLCLLSCAENAYNMSLRRSSIEDHYARSLIKLNAKAEKIADQNIGYSLGASLFHTMHCI
jgi:hypothetical protein